MNTTYHDSKSELICSLFAAFVKSCIIQPFDFLRIRIQTSSSKSIKIYNLITGFRKEEGLSVFMKGTTPTFTGSMIASIFHLTFYQRFMFYFKFKFFHEESILDTHSLDIFKIKMKKSDEIGETRNFLHDDIYRRFLVGKLSLLAGLAGLFSGILLSIITTPIDNVRIRLQSMQNLKSVTNHIQEYVFTSPSECIKTVFREKGINGFYIAFPVCMMRESVASLIYFFSFEYLKNTYKVRHDNREIPLSRMFIYGGLSGMLSWVFTLPIDCVKTKLISDSLTKKKQFNGIVDCIIKIYTELGVKGFFSGLSVMLIRAYIVNGAMLSSFEMCRNELMD